MGKSDLARGFLLYKDYINPVSKMSDETAGKLFKAILAYVNEMPLPELGETEDTAFCFIKAQLDINIESYKERCAINAANGAKGGRPRKAGARDNNPEKPSALPETEEKPSVLEEQGEAPAQEQPKKRKRAKREAAPKPPKKQYAEFVSMTEAEYAKLVEKYGEAAALRMIEILDNYKGQENKRYNSDYRAILNWVVERYTEEQARRPQQRKPAPEAGHVDTDADWTAFYQEGYKK